MKNKIMRVGALLFAVILLLSAFIVPTSANDAAFLETLIDTDKYVYVANFVLDTASKNKKYAYKYVNMAYVMLDTCAKNDLLTDPNACFRLNDTGDYSYKGVYHDWTNGNQGVGKTNLEMYMLLEGYFMHTNNREPIENDTTKAFAARAIEKHICSTPKNKTSPLSYPGYYTVAITTEQSEYAQQVHSATVRSLNGILSAVNDGDRFTSVADLVNKSILIRPDNENNVVVLPPSKDNSGYGGYAIVYADLNNTNSSTSIIIEDYAGHAAKALKKASDAHVDPDNPVTIDTKTVSSAFLDDLNLPRASTDKGLYCYLFPIKGENNSTYVLDVKNASYFVYAWPKGYMNITYGDSENPETFYNAEFRKANGDLMNYVSSQGDSPWITVHMLSFYANTVYKQEQLSIGTYVEPDASVFSKIISSIFDGILYAIRGILQLSNIDELVFNLGDRGSLANNYGLMKDDWWDIVLQYQLLFQALAWVVLICGFIKTLISLNLSTINPQKRMSLYDTVQKFIVVGIGLVVMIPVVQFMLECNNAIVDLFASQVDTSSLNMPLVTNVFVQILVGFVWLTLMLYINFIYIMRSVTVAILIASGPFFISTMAFSRHGSSSLFVSWAKELIANVFVQSVHAFILSFLLQLMTSGRFLETFAIVLSIIPLTEMFRGLIFAGAGGSTSQMAKGLADVTKKGIDGVRRGATAAAAGIMNRTSDDNLSQSGADEKDKDGGGGGKGKNGQQSVASMTNAKNAQRLSRIGQLAGSDEKHKGLKIAGNVAAIAGTSAFSAMNDIGEIGSAIQDFALTGETGGVAKATEGAIGNAYSSARGLAGGAIQARRDNKARTGNSPDKSKTNLNDVDRMGASAFDEAKGSTVTASGGGIIAESNSVARSAYVEMEDKKDNISGLSSRERAAALSAYYDIGSSNAKEDDVRIDNGDGSTTAGKMYSFTRNGKNHSFVISNEKAEEALREHPRVAPSYTPDSSRESSYFAKPDQKTVISARSDNGSNNAAVQNELARIGGKDAYTKQDANGNTVAKRVLNENGEDCDLKDYAGSTYMIPKAVDKEAKEEAEALASSVSSGQKSATISNSVTEFANACPDDDISNKDTTGDYTNAAIISLAGEAVEGKDGVYQFAGREFTTGMSKSEAAEYAAGVGITDVRSSGGNLSYRQSAPMQGSTPYDVRHMNGKTIAQHKLDIGEKGGPKSFVPNAYGGGKLSYSSIDDAERSMRKRGEITMAEAIHKMRGQQAGKRYDSGIATLKKTFDGGFEISYENKAFRESGIKLERGAGDRSALFVSSTNGDVVNPFYSDSEIVPQRDDDSEQS